MKTKLFYLAVLLMVLLPLSSFAQPNFDFEGTEVTLSGTITVTNLIHPVLKSGNAQYLLMVPRFLDLNDGDQISITGIELSAEDIADHPGLSESVKEGEKVVFVKTITINGKTYDLENDFRRGGRNGKGHGRGYGKNGKGNGQGGFGPCWNDDDE